MQVIDPRIKEWATERQREYIDAVNKHGSNQKAAEALGLSRRTVDKGINLAKAAATRAGYSSEQASRKTAEPRLGPKILVLPDVQAKPGTDFGYLGKIGQYAVDKRPDYIVCIGDFADMPSLSSYDRGKKSFEGRRYRADVNATHDAMEAFLMPIVEHNRRATKAGKPEYQPKMIMTLGNHEHRIVRAVEDDAKLDGVLSVDDLAYSAYGWTVYPFLEVVEIEGIAFSHYFQTGVMGRPATSAQAQLNKKHQSCIAGHQQGLQIATGFKANGQMITSIIAGSCYEHDEDYLGPQGNKHWRGFLMLHDCRDGSFDPMFVSLNYINQRY